MNIYDIYDGTEKVGEAVEWSDGCVTFRRPPKIGRWAESWGALREQSPEYTFVPHGSPPPEPDTNGWIAPPEPDTNGWRALLMGRRVAIDQPFGQRAVLGTPQQARNLADKIRAVADYAYLAAEDG